MQLSILRFSLFTLFEISADHKPLNMRSLLDYSNPIRDDPCYQIGWSFRYWLNSFCFVTPFYKQLYENMTQISNVTFPRKLVGKIANLLITKSLTTVLRARGLLTSFYQENLTS